MKYNVLIQSVTSLLGKWLDFVGNALNLEASQKLLALQADEETQRVSKNLPIATPKGN